VISCDVRNSILIHFNEHLLSINIRILYNFIYYCLYYFVVDYVHCNVGNLHNAMQADGLRVPKLVACGMCCLVWISTSIRCTGNENSDTNII
jgi:hypothetical protein